MSVKKRGFAALSTAEVKRLAKIGGKKAHDSGNAYKFTSEVAARAGRISAAVRKRRRLAMRTKEQVGA